MPKTDSTVPLTRSSSPVLANSLRWRILQDVAQLKAFRPEWETWQTNRTRLTPQSNDLMMTPEWLVPWWEIYGPLQRRSLRVVQFWHGEQLVGIAPLSIRQRIHCFSARLPGLGIPFRSVESLGSGEPEVDEIGSEFLTLLTRPGWEASVAQGLVATLQAGALGPWDEFVLSRMDETEPMPHLLTEAFRSMDYRSTLTPVGVAPYTLLPRTWEEYLQRLPKKARYSIRRDLRNFEAWAGGPGELQQANTLGELREGQAILLRLHQERWHNGGAFASPHFQRFHERVMPALLQRGALELLWLCVRGEPIASIYSIIWDNKVYFYQCGRKINLPPSVRPGKVLLCYALQKAIQAGRREFDFLGGADPYKMDLAEHVRPLVEVRAARPSLRERIRLLVEKSKACLRNFKIFRGPVT